MSKVQYACIDCGKLSNPIYLRGNQFPETYRCVDCAHKRVYQDPVWKEKVVRHCKEMAKDPVWQEKQRRRNQNRTQPKLQFSCIDCGKLSPIRRAASFKQTEKTYRCKRCAIKHVFDLKHQNPTYLDQQRIKLEKKNKRKISNKTRYACIDCGKLSSLRNPSGFKQSKETYRCQSCGLKKMHNDPIKGELAKQRREKMYNDPLWKEAVTNGARKRVQDPKARANNKAAMKKLFQNPEFRENLLISITGQGFWYGHPVLCPENRKNKVYCEKWNKDLWRRIDAAWDYRSAISGVTRFENYKQEHLSRHHVYWQEKACCEWDKDKQGYYAMINLGNSVKPRWYKHYIKGDPNKFVLLTRAEHKLIEGNLKDDKTKLAWVLFFEDLIEKRESEGKRCYLTKEEYETYKIEHADIITLYDPPKERKLKSTHQETLLMD